MVLPVLSFFEKLPIRHRAGIISVLIIVATLALYWQVGGHEFIHFDDDLYVFENQYVKDGFSSEGMKWAFEIRHQEKRTYWHPLTWISHMLDCHVFGLNAGRHHMVNVLWHSLNCALLFLLLLRMTGALWRSVFVAALFAFHPINVDSVAWLAERKNLLSTFFWLLTMYCYVFYIMKKTVWRYLFMTSAFIFGLLSKPMLVTLPLVLLLMDLWPLHRLNLFPYSGRDKGVSGSTGQGLFMLVSEKIPLLILSFLSIYLSMASLKAGDFVITTGSVPMGLRISNAIVSYAVYLAKLFWPVNLTFFYPYPNAVPAWQVGGALLVLAAISALALMLVKKAPYVLVGWLWYLGTLLPVSGIIQGGHWPAIAERWAYVPFIGLYIAIAWGVADIFARSRYYRTILAVVVLTLIVVLMVRTWFQTGYWRNDAALYQHALEVDPANYVAQTNMGNVYRVQGEYDKATYHYLESLRVQPNHIVTNLALAGTYFQMGKYPEASSFYTRVLQIQPGSFDAHFNLANALAAQGKYTEAIAHYRWALQKNPDSPRLNRILGDLLVMTGEADRSVNHYQKVIRYYADDPVLHMKFANALVSINELDKAIVHYMETLKLDPGLTVARDNLKAVTKRRNLINEQIAKVEDAINADERNVQLLFNAAVLSSGKADYENALKYLERVILIQPQNPDTYYNIACIKAKQNKPHEAVRILEEAVRKGFDRWDVLRSDNDLKNIRDTEFYKNLLKNH